MGFLALLLAALAILFATTGTFFMFRKRESGFIVAVFFIMCANVSGLGAIATGIAWLVQQFM